MFVHFVILFVHFYALISPGIWVRSFVKSILFVNCWNCFMLIVSDEETGGLWVRH